MNSLGILGIYRGRAIGRAWQQKLDYYEDGSERIIYNNMILDSDLQNFLHQIIMRFGETSHKHIVADGLKKLDEVSMIVFKNISCEEAAELMKKYEIKNIFSEFEKDRSDDFLSLIMHLITCHSRKCLKGSVKK